MHTCDLEHLYLHPPCALHLAGKNVPAVRRSTVAGHVSFVVPAIEMQNRKIPNRKT